MCRELRKVVVRGGALVSRKAVIKVAMLNYVIRRVLKAYRSVEKQGGLIPINKMFD